MKNSLISLASMLGGILAVAVAVALPPVRNFLFNYHQFGGGNYGLLVSVLAFYLLGLYFTALLLRQFYPNQLQTVEPSLLVIGNAVGLLIAISLLNCFAWTFSNRLARLGANLISFFFVLLCTVLAGSVKRQQGSQWQSTFLRGLVPAALMATTVHSSLIVMLAAPTVRQRWAYTEFSDYESVVEDIQQCPAITGRIASIKTVAPTWGRNFTIYDPGSSGHSGEFTLEVIGPEQKGIANSQFHIGTSLYRVKFTHDNKTERLLCPEPN